MEPAYGPYERSEEPPRRSRGCLWGCLAVFLAGGLLIAGLFGYGAWYFFNRFENDARIQSIMATVRSDPRAEMVLGRHIRVVDVEVHTFNFASGRGKTATYTLHVAGTDGEGELVATLDLNGPEAKVTRMILTGIDGHPHVLVGKEPKNPFMRSI